MKLKRSNTEVSPMDVTLIQTAFGRVASHISNIESMKEIVDETVRAESSLQSAVASLEARLADAEVTLRTDIRILINECRHLMMGRQADE